MGSRASPAPAALSSTPLGSRRGEPAPDELDFAILRLARPAGAEIVPGTAFVRGWVDLSQDPPLPQSPILIVQHPAGGPVKLAWAHGPVEANSGGTRISYATDTLPGSSGSPVFDRNYRAVALHRGRGPWAADAPGLVQNNQGVPLGKIRAALPAEVRALLKAPPEPRLPVRSLSELAYLNSVLRAYEYWAEKYTPLKGIAEVQVPAKDGRHLDLPSPFMPTAFEKLVEFGFGEQRRVERVPVADLREAVRQYRRLVLLGEPGSGKSTTLWRLACEYARRALDDPAAPLPVFVPLDRYGGPEGALRYVQSRAGALGDWLPARLGDGRAILLLDGLNEMPQAGYKERVGRIQKLLDAYPAASAVVTCRALDYVETLSLEKLEIKPLEPVQQHDYLCRYLGEADGEKLFWLMAGPQGPGLWRAWQAAGGTWEQFWTAEKMPDAVYRRTNAAQYRLWAKLRKGSLPPMLAFGRNPFMLVMLAQVYAGGGVLPANLGKLFAAFVATLLKREADRCEAGRWPGDEAITEPLGALAYAMQRAGERGTSVAREWALRVLGAGGEEVLYWAAGASLLEQSGGQVRFVHQLIQEYFAATAWEGRLRAGEDLRSYWPEGWLTPSGWEETAVLLAGTLADMGWLVERLLGAHPVLAARCIGESGGPKPSADVIRRVQERLVTIATGKPKVRERDAAGDALNWVGDPRPGVGLRADGLPHIAWCDVPAGPFLMGNTRETDDEAWEDEARQQSVTLAAYRISKYPITNAQYAAFVADGGYTARWQACWTDAGWAWKGERAGPGTRGGAFDLPNHPVVMVTWYEADAFCQWLGRRLGLAVALPTEAQWEKAARWTDGRRYPWAGELTPEHVNYVETGIGSTTAVGIFPQGENPQTGVSDMSGNVWEWCSTRWRDSYNEKPDDRREGQDPRVLRGGAFGDYARLVRCAARSGFSPYFGYRYFGFRVVASPSHS